MNLALFDFDGTITTREMFPDFMHLAVNPFRLALGKLLLSPLIIAYKLGFVSGIVTRAAIVRFAFSGVAFAKVQGIAIEFAKKDLPRAERAQAMARLQWHKDRGDKIVVVSGAFDLYLRPWCEANHVELICSALEHHKGVLTGRYLGSQCVLTEKARRVQQTYSLEEFERIYAYGDTVEDTNLLALAHEAYYQWEKWPR